MDRASWPALILCSPQPFPSALLPTLSTQGRVWGEEQPWQGLPYQVPSLKPGATQPGETCCWEPWLPIQGSLDQLCLCCCPRELQRPAPVWALLPDGLLGP